MSKKKLNIPKNKKVLLFILSHKYSSKRKGLKYVLEYLEKSNRDDLLLLTMNCKNIKIKNERIQHININLANSVQRRIDIYSASDIFLMPSLIESFGQTVLESQSCDCPVVTFKNTGSEDLVNHKRTGYLSSYANQKDFNTGVEWLLNKSFPKNIIRNKVKEKYSYNEIAKQYKQKVFKQIKE